VLLPAGLQSFEERLHEFPKHMQTFTELSSWLSEHSKHELVKFSAKVGCALVKHCLEELACFRISRPNSHHLYELVVDRERLNALLELRPKR